MNKARIIKKNSNLKNLAEAFMCLIQGTFLVINRTYVPLTAPF